VSEERKKFSKCGEGEKKCKCRISGVRKKKEIERKVPRKKIKVFFFWMKILLSSCSLVGFYVSLQVEYAEKNDENFQSIFQVNVLKLKVRFAEKDKV
jgi:hypothetical protein